MAFKKGTGAALLILALGSVLVCDGSIPPKQYIVGDDEHWDGVNVITDWPKGKTFYVGDKLEFIYNADQFDVVITDEEGYDNCEVTAHSTRLDADYDNVVTLPFGQSYFITSFAPACQGGTKLAVYANPRPPALHR